MLNFRCTNYLTFFMAYTIIGIKQLHKELTQITKKVSRGESFLVMKHSTPVFRIEPENTAGAKKYTLDELLGTRFKFKTKDKNLSKKVDEIVYGV
jgi:antitoxin (DNA-binding transcriptional repressor) of toxin-antitoxin stability system